MPPIQWKIGDWCYVDPIIEAEHPRVSNHPDPDLVYRIVELGVKEAQIETAIEPHQHFNVLIAALFPQKSANRRNKVKLTSEEWDIVAEIGLLYTRCYFEPMGKLHEYLAATHSLAEFKAKNPTLYRLAERFTCAEHNTLPWKV